MQVDEHVEAELLAPLPARAQVPVPVLAAVPGLILHLALIPVLVIALEKAGLSLNQ